MRRGLLLAVAVLAIGMLAGRVVSAPLLVVHNPSPSMPLGWYLRVPLEPAVGRIVVIKPPAAAVAHGWPSDILLIKPIAAMAGDHVCLRGRTNVLINSTPVAPMRPVPYWEGCRTLTANELFLFAPARIDSIDGRVFGPVSRDAVIGVFTPIWTETP
jgi:type IV secretory pathway protease TraF